MTSPKNTLSTQPEMIVLIDYGSGNLRSAEKALQRASQDTHSNCLIEISDKPDKIAKADRIILPGVGAFGDCMAGLKKRDGLLEALDEAVEKKGRPFLGICVGMQLMAKHGLEYGRHKGLGWIEADVKALSPSDQNLKIPHMGWNQLHHRQNHPLLQSLPEGSDVYFVHSFAMDMPLNHPDLLSVSDYGGPVVALVAQDNKVGTQFHPEKSQKLGLAFLSQFLNWRP